MLFKKQPAPQPRSSIALNGGGKSDWITIPKPVNQLDRSYFAGSVVRKNTFLLYTRGNIPHQPLPLESLLLLLPTQSGPFLRNVSRFVIKIFHSIPADSFATWAGLCATWDLCAIRRRCVSLAHEKFRHILANQSLFIIEKLNPSFVYLKITKTWRLT